MGHYRVVMNLSTMLSSLIAWAGRRPFLVFVIAYLALCLMYILCTKPPRVLVVEKPDPEDEASEMEAAAVKARAFADKMARARAAKRAKQKPEQPATVGADKPAGAEV